ncbi:MAG: asparaginase [Bacillota bacterium]|nr:asparaginase [Bacillota bacterium]
MKKILFINTGGTISCRRTEEGLLPSLTARGLLNHVPEVRGLCRCDTLDLMSLDSSDLSPRHWLSIASTIEKNYEEYDGFILCHGSDTMSYTASALSYLLADSPKPIVLTGAQRPIVQDGSDGKENLLNAFAYALYAAASKVRVVFGGKIIAGTRAKKCRTHSDDAFCSTNFPLIATARHGEVDMAFEEERPSEYPATFDHDLDCRVALLKLAPNGFEAEHLTWLAERCHGIILEGYGLGNLPMGENDAFLRALEKATNQGVIIIGATQAPLEGTHMERYAVGNRAKNCGLVESYDMTVEAAFTKLMYLLSQNLDKETLISRFYTTVDHDICLP